jgi:putative NADPH-quinone reductase
MTLMAAKRIVIVEGHPDAGAARFEHVLADAYAAGAERGDHDLRRLPVAALDFPILRSKADWDNGAAPPDILAAQQTLAWADHLVILFPLWMGDMPALLKGFFEQVARPSFLGDISKPGKGPLAGKSARIVITMGMPAAVYRLYFQAHGLENLKRNILGFAGVRPIRTSLIGMIEAPNAKGRQRWLARMGRFGEGGR